MVIARPGQFGLHRRSQIAPILVTRGCSVVVVVSVIVRIVIIRIPIIWETKPEEEAIIEVMVMTEEAVPIMMEEMISIMMKEMISIVVKREIMSTRETASPSRRMETSSHTMSPSS